MPSSNVGRRAYACLGAAVAPPPASVRVTALDATRGVAMLLVCLSHFGDVYLRRSAPAVDDQLKHFTLAATPAFILTSGLVLALLHWTGRADMDRVRRKLVDRALLLLTVARVLVVAAHVPYHGLAGSLASVYVTDTIAICVVAGTLIVPVLRPSVRLAAAFALYAVCNLALFAWRPAANSYPQLLKHLLVGHLSPGEESLLTNGFPLLPWFAVYLACTALGTRVARAAAGPAGRTVPTLSVIGIACLAAGVLLRVNRPVWLLLEQLADQPGLAAHLSSYGQKLPPGPAYLCFYVGCAVLLATCCVWLERTSRGAPLLGVAALVGRHSLLAFVVQYLLYFTVLHSLQLRYTALWPLLFLASLLLVLAAVYLWQRIGGQRLLTIGYPGLIRRAERLAAGQGSRVVLRRSSGRVARPTDA